MSIKLSIACILYLFCITRLFAQEEPTYVTYSNPRVTIKYMREGLLCSGIYKKHYKINFIHRDKLSSEKMKKLDLFLQKKNIWSMNEKYKGSLVLDAPWSHFVLYNVREHKCKNILYFDCYNQTLDSLMVYINDLIPKNKRKYYNIVNYHTSINNDTCR